MSNEIRRYGWLALPALLLAACSSITSSPRPNLSLNGHWILLPAINNTETPQAGGRLDSIAASLLFAHGVQNLTLYPAANPSSDALFEAADRKGQETALSWARSQGAQYAVAGAVQEWHYKTGLDGEPAVGISISIIDLSSGHVVWSGSGSRTGSSRDSVSAVADGLVYALLDEALGHE